MERQMKIVYDAVLSTTEPDLEPRPAQRSLTARLGRFAMDALLAYAQIMCAYPLTDAFLITERDLVPGWPTARPNLPESAIPRRQDCGESEDTAPGATARQTSVRHGSGLLSRMTSLWRRRGNNAAKPALTDGAEFHKARFNG
jgi:hypothetical protein